MRRWLFLAAIAITACSDTFAADEREWDEGATESQALTAFTATQRHNLAVINEYRAKKHLVPLRLSAQLSDFAEAGSVQLSHDHRAHGHFIDAGPSKWSRGFRGRAAENQGDVDGWPRLADDPGENEIAQIDAIMKAMFDEGPGEGRAHGHYEAMMNPAFRRVGIGVLMVDGMMYLTNDFSE